jgi:ADP-heptose:LPS heptosyltransferase
VPTQSGQQGYPVSPRSHAWYHSSPVDESATRSKDRHPPRQWAWRSHFCTPAVHAIRLAYPDTEIVWLGRDLHRQFFSHRPGPVDRVIVVPPSQGVRDEPEGEDDATLQRFFETMAAEQFDVAMQLHGGGRFSNAFVKKLGARMTVGLRAPDAVALDRWVHYSYFQHEVLRYLEVHASGGRGG